MMNKKRYISIDDVKNMLIKGLNYAKNDMNGAKDLSNDFASGNRDRKSTDGMIVFNINMGRAEAYEAMLNELEKISDYIEIGKNL